MRIGLQSLHVFVADVIEISVLNVDHFMPESFLLGIRGIIGIQHNRERAIWILDRSSVHTFRQFHKLYIDNFTHFKHLPCRHMVSREVSNKLPISTIWILSPFHQHYHVIEIF